MYKLTTQVFVFGLLVLVGTPNRDTMPAHSSKLALFFFISFLILFILFDQKSMLVLGKRKYLQFS